MSQEDIYLKVSNLKRNFTESQKSTRFKKGNIPWNKDLPMNDEYKKNWKKSIENKNWYKNK